MGLARRLGRKGRRGHLLATGPVIRSCSTEPEGRAETTRELRTEKPWQGDGGPGFNSRRLHFLRITPVVMTGVFLMFVQVAPVSARVRQVDQGGIGFFLQTGLRPRADHRKGRGSCPRPSRRMFGTVNQPPTGLEGKSTMDTSYRSMTNRVKVFAGHKDVRISPHFGRVWLITKEDKKCQVVGSVNRA